MKKFNSFSPMKKGMLIILGCSSVLCMAFGLLYYFFMWGWLLSCAITFGVTAYHFAIRFLAPLLILPISHKKYNFKNAWFRQKSWEPKFYEFIKVKKWKKKVSYFTYSPEEFSTELYSYEEIVNNMCHAEIVHEVIIILSFTSLLFAIIFSPFWIFLITAVFAAMIDMQFVILQRYNRPRMIKFIKHKTKNCKTN